MSRTAAHAKALELIEYGAVLVTLPGQTAELAIRDAQRLADVTQETIGRLTLSQVAVDFGFIIK